MGLGQQLGSCRDLLGFQIRDGRFEIRITWRWQSGRCAIESRESDLFEQAQASAGEIRPPEVGVSLCPAYWW